MLAYLRYALATICFVLSFASLGLWGQTVALSDVWSISYRGISAEIGISADYGFASCWVSRTSANIQQLGWSTAVFDAWEAPWMAGQIEADGSFGASDDSVYFPLWYAALVFAIAGIGALRLGRRFTLRSAIVATTVVAGLLGMMVAL